jgi:hypothetical protein
MAIKSLDMSTKFSGKCMFFFSAVVCAMFAIKSNAKNAFIIAFGRHLNMHYFTSADVIVLLHSSCYLLCTSKIAKPGDQSAYMEGNEDERTSASLFSTFMSLFRGIGLCV